MAGNWWADLRDLNDVWQGLTLTVNIPAHSGLAMEMLSGHNGRMALQLNGEPLFWATMLSDHSGVWLIFNDEHSAQSSLLAPITSADVELLQQRGGEAAEWCRYFARQLMDDGRPLLAPGRWLLRPMSYVPPTAPYAHSREHNVERWRFSSPSDAGDIGFGWTLYGEDIHDLSAQATVRFVDWWWGGNLLLSRYNILPDSGRLKWWRKKAREGTLPPILVWAIAGLASFVILDGHYRLQAAIAEGIPPRFIVLSELAERQFMPDEDKRARIERALELQQRKHPGVSIDGVNQTLIGLYSTRYLYAPTHSRAILGNGAGWEAQVTAYLQRRGEQAALAQILKREG